MEELFNGSFDPFFSSDGDEDFDPLVTSEEDDDDGYWVSTAQAKEMESQEPPECPKATDWKNTNIEELKDMSVTIDQARQQIFYQSLRLLCLSMEYGTYARIVSYCIIISSVCSIHNNNNNNNNNNNHDRCWYCDHYGRIIQRIF